MAKRTVRFLCPGCKKRLKAARPSEAGKKTSCPFCGCQLELPLPPENTRASTILEAYIPKDSAAAAARQSAGSEAERYPSPAQPAKNPFLYAIGGAALVLLIGGGLVGAFMAGQGNASAEADGQQPVAAAGDQDSNPQQVPQQQSLAAGQSAPAPTTVPNRNEPTSSNDSQDNLESASADKAGLEQGGLSGQAESDPEKETSRDDSNRPEKKPFDLIQPSATIDNAASRSFRPIVVEVPIFIPPIDGGKKAKPDLSVVIRPKDTTQTVIKVDHFSAPGISTELVVSLDKTPETAVEIKVSADLGLVVKPTKLSFAAKVAPIEQVITVTGNGTAKMPRGPSKIHYLKIDASGGGLTADSPAQIPVLVLRRNSFRTDSGVPIVRSDATGLGGTTTTLSGTNLSGWTFNFGGLSPLAMVGAQYTSQYVQLNSTGPALPNLRLFDDHLEFELSPGSGTYQAGITGSWQ